MTSRFDFKSMLILTVLTSGITYARPSTDVSEINENGSGSGEQPCENDTDCDIRFEICQVNANAASCEPPKTCQSKFDLTENRSCYEHYKGFFISKVKKWYF